jgi:hypothetical protein
MPGGPWRFYYDRAGDGAKDLVCLACFWGHGGSLFRLHVPIGDILVRISTSLTNDDDIELITQC